VPDATPAPDEDPRPGSGARRLLIEVTDKGTGCAACQYMHAAVLKTLRHFPGGVAYRRVNLRTPQGRRRFIALCTGLYGHEQVHRHLRLAPVPSIFMDDRLIFATIPDEDRLKDAVARRVSSYR